MDHCKANNQDLILAVDHKEQVEAVQKQAEKVL